MWQELSDAESKPIYRGCRIRLIRSKPRLQEKASVTDYIVFDMLNDESGMALLQLTGYDAGIIHSILPKESVPAGSRAVSMEWFRTNWRDWFSIDGEEFSLLLNRRKLTVKRLMQIS